MKKKAKKSKVKKSIVTKKTCPAIKKKVKGLQDFPSCTIAKGQIIVSSLQFMADLENLAAVRSASEKAGINNGLSTRQVTRLKLCVDEAFTNIVRHAFKGKGQCDPVFVDYIKGPKDFSVCLRDKGNPFKLNAKKLTWPNLEKYIELEKKGGLGLFVMKKFSDHLEITNKKGVNILTLRYKLGK